MKKNYNFKQNNSVSNEEDITDYDMEFYNQKDRNKRRYETNKKNKERQFYEDDKWN